MSLPRSTSNPISAGQVGLDGAECAVSRAETLPTRRRSTGAQCSTRHSPPACELTPMCVLTRDLFERARSTARSAAQRSGRSRRRRAPGGIVGVEIRLGAPWRVHSGGCSAHRRVAVQRQSMHRWSGSSPRELAGVRRAAMGLSSGCNRASAGRALSEQRCMSRDPAGRSGRAGRSAHRTERSGAGARLAMSGPRLARRRFGGGPLESSRVQAVRVWWCFGRAPGRGIRRRGRTRSHITGAGGDPREDESARSGEVSADV